MGTRSGVAARSARVFTPRGLRVQVAGTPGALGQREAGRRGGRELACLGFLSAVFPPRTQTQQFS